MTREYVKDALLPIQDILESLDEKINVLLPKPKKNRVVIPLRDPIDNKLFSVFYNAAGCRSNYKADLKAAQLKIAYTILFYVGLRVNEMRFFKEKHILDAIKTAQFNLVHFKQKQPHIHVISQLAVKQLTKLKPYYDIVFVKYKYQYLFGKEKPVSEKYLIKTIS